MPAMESRSELNGTSAPVGNSNGVDARPQPLANGSQLQENAVNGNGIGNGDGDQRPSSAPGRRNGNTPLETRDDIESERSRRPSKPLLLRSKSEFAQRIRDRDEPDQVEEEIPEWGARHGFEDHYQSEDMVSQLANVSGVSCSLSAFELFAPVTCPFYYQWLGRLFTRFIKYDSSSSWTTAS